MFTVRRYGVMVLANFSLLVIDLLINSFSDFAGKDPVILLLLFITQGVCLIFAVISIVLSFFSTYIFQAGFIELLFDRFRLTIIVCVIYLLMTICLNIWMLTVRWNAPKEFYWTKSLLTMYVCQRILSGFHYYFFKRSILRISDPRFYEDFDITYQRNRA